LRDVVCKPAGFFLRGDPAAFALCKRGFGVIDGGEDFAASAFTLRPQREGFLRGIFRTAESAAFDSALYQGLLVGREIDVHKTIEPLNRPRLPDALPWPLLFVNSKSQVLNRKGRKAHFAFPAISRRPAADQAEVERLIRHTYQFHNKYGLMMKTLFLSGARVDEFVHIQVDDLHLDANAPQIHIRHGKKESNRYVPVLPALAQELRTHLNGRRHGYLFETNRNDCYSVRTVQSIVKSQAQETGMKKRVYPHLLRHVSMAVRK
jgi:integrase